MCQAKMAGYKLGYLLELLGDLKILRFLRGKEKNIKIQKFEGKTSNF